MVTKLERKKIEQETIDKLLKKAKKERTKSLRRKFRFLLSEFFLIQAWFMFYLFMYHNSVYSVVALAFISLIAWVAIITVKNHPQKINYPQVLSVFAGLFILKFFDIVSTVRFVGIGGIEMEANTLAKWFMYQFGVLEGLWIHNLLFILPVLALLIYFNAWGTKKSWKIVSWGLIAVFTIVPIINFMSV